MYEPDLTQSYSPEGVVNSRETPQSTETRGTSVGAFGVAALAELAAEPLWTLEEEGFTLAREHEVESLFAISNGYIGNRGSLAEGSPLSAPASFVAGVFEIDPRPNAVPGFMVLPDWTGVRAWVEDQLLTIDQGQALAHRRVLDMRRGVLWRDWRQRSAATSRFSCSVRAVSVQEEVKSSSRSRGQNRVGLC
jgi:trehalose/maltose hydrolase-like predicted phosphorylase